MPMLSETQSRFAAYVLRDIGSAQAAEGIKTNGLSAEQRLYIYRNNTQLGLTEALRDGYPVINKLVGTEFFNLLARIYIRRFPPKAGCLLFFGGQFADFITDFKPAEGLPYLPDVARLEWLWHEAFHEADAAALDIASLADINSDSYSDLGFALHPTVRLIASSYPILPIWQTNQDDYQSDGNINLDEGDYRLLVYRPELDVLLVALPEAEFQFLSSLAKGLTLCEAVDAALLTDRHFNLSPVLQYWFANGLFTDFFVTTSARN